MPISYEYTVRSKKLSDFLNLVIFEVFGVKFPAKKSIFQNCLSGSPFQLVLWGNSENPIFGRKFHSKNLKTTKFRSRTKTSKRTLKLTGHLIVDLENSNKPEIVDQICKTLSIADLLSVRLSHPQCETIIYRQFLLDSTRFGHHIDNMSLYSKIKFRTYAFYDTSIKVLETRHPGKFKLQELAEKNLNSRLKRLKLSPSNSNGNSNHENTEDEEILSNSGSSDKDSGVDVNEAQVKRKIEAEKRRERDTRSIFVGNIHYHSNPDDIKLHFATHCGEVNQVTFIKDYQTQNFKGYCFVEFCRPESVRTGVKIFEHHKLIFRSEKRSFEAIWGHFWVENRDFKSFWVKTCHFRSLVV